jgi:4-amino-4-deoxy-L-arabinose transferase-like glycosyltransferase
MFHGFKAHRSHLIAAACLAFAVFLAGMNRVPVPTVDGAVRASMARNIVETGQLWPITYEGRVFTDHPPLFVWLTALSYKVFGITDFAANFVPRLFAFLTVVMTAFIALEAGLGAGTALLSAFVLCLTRDFVLSSVRGYIEPVLSFFIYAGLWLTLRQKRARAPWAAALAGASVWLAAYSKGPVALWPLLLFGAILFWNGNAARRRGVLLGAYLAVFGAFTLAWAAWVETSGHWHYWRDYLFGQVVSSAVEGRGGRQDYEPLYFAAILLKYYWPWLPLLAWSAWRTARSALSLEFTSHLSYSLIFGVMAAGFVIPFSVMRWKFWYYIAPAYPALSLFIAASLEGVLGHIAARPAAARAATGLAAAWIAAVSVFPIELHLDRVPEVRAFAPAILNSGVVGPVWFVRNPRDHNMVGTSGEWYFHRIVRYVGEKSEKDWERTELKAPAWIITGRDAAAACDSAWCRRSRFIQEAGQSALLYFGGR